MYDLDLNTCTMRQVITRSAVCHPSMFKDSMLEVSRYHWSYSGITTNAKAARIALDMANDLRRMADDLNNEDFDADSLALSEVVQAFQVACTLQAIPRNVSASIAEKGV